jgi:transposase-like protein
VKSAARSRSWSAPRSAFAGFRFPAEVIVVAVRWYLRYGLSYRDVEELLVERGIEVDHVTVYRWVQRCTPLLADAARFARHSPGDRWYVDETDVKVNGVWRYVYRAVDQHGQVIDVLLTVHRDAVAARRFLTRALRTLKVTPKRGDHRCRAGLSRRARRRGPRSVAPRRAVRKQSDRGRSRPAQAQAETDAWATN